MAEDLIVIEDKPISFRTLGKILPKLPKTKEWKFIVKMSEFAQFGFCPYTAWHFSQGTTPILISKVEQARLNLLLPPFSHMEDSSPLFRSSTHPLLTSLWWSPNIHQKIGSRFPE